MKETVTITRHEMAAKCSEALNDVYGDEDPKGSMFLSMLVFSGLIIAKVFKEEDKDNEAVH